MRPYYFEIIDRRKKILQKIIFEDEYDYQQFIDILRYYKDEEKCSFKLYSYCLMDNHVHLLIEHTNVSLDEIMKRIEIKFVKISTHRPFISRKV